MALLVLLGVGLLATRWVRFNVQPSVPYGLYRVLPVPPRLERGMLVVLRPPASVHQWFPWWHSMLKPIAALPGDQVCILSVGVWIRGEPYGAVLTEAQGASLPRLRGCFVVPDGEVFLATKTMRTLDSRYYGAVRVAVVRAHATPLWTWR